MKKQLAVVMLIGMVLCLCTCAKRAPDPRPDYLQMMVDAAHSGSVEFGRGIERLRGISRGEDDYISFDELYLLSQYITKVFENPRYSDELRMCAAEVVLNRMASPEYPDEMSAVIFQEGMYPEISEEEINACRYPSKVSIKIALTLLQGKREMEDDVLVLTKKPQNEVYATFCDGLLGNLYLCKG